MYRWAASILLPMHHHHTVPLPAALLTLYQSGVLFVLLQPVSNSLWSWVGSETLGENLLVLLCRNAQEALLFSGSHSVCMWHSWSHVTVLEAGEVSPWKAVVVLDVQSNPRNLWFREKRPWDAASALWGGSGCWWRRQMGKLVATGRVYFYTWYGVEHTVGAERFGHIFSVVVSVP